MSRVAGPLLLIALCSPAANGSDLPPGAVARLGTDRFRAGSHIEQLALAPDGTQYATARRGPDGSVFVAVCDAASGRPIREAKLSRELFRGLVWGPDGASAVVMRAAPAPKARRDESPTGDFGAGNGAGLKADLPLPLTALTDLPAAPGGPTDHPDRSTEYTDVRIGADGTRAAAMWKSKDGTKHAVHVFEMRPADRAATLTGTIDLGAEGADEVLVSADGRTVVTLRKLVTDDPNERAEHFAATTWDSTGKPGKPVQVQTAHGKRPLLTPDGGGLILLTPEGEERGFDLFDLATRQRRKLARWKCPVPPADSASPTGRGGFAFSADGRTLAAAINGKTFVIDFQTGREIGTLEGHTGTPTAVAFSADGTILATADAHGLVRLWNRTGLTPRNDAPGHRAPVRHAELSPDGKRLLTWAEDETVRLWDVATGKELRAFAGAIGSSSYGERRPGAAAAALTPDGTAVLYSTNKRLVARDLLSGLEVPLPGDMKELGARFAVFAPDGEALLTWDAHRDEVPFEVWDWPTGKRRFAGHQSARQPAPGFSPDSATVHIQTADLKRWDARTGKELEPASAEEHTSAVAPLLALRPNPRHLLYISARGPQVIECGTGKAEPLVRSAPRSGDARFNTPEGIALAPVGGLFARSRPRAGDAPVQLSETATGAVRRELHGHRGAVRVLGFTPDGSRLLTAGGDHTVLVWDVRLRSVPLPDALKQETSAAKLWEQLATGAAPDAYLAMARLGREPAAAIKMAKLRIKPATKASAEADPGQVADCRAIELLEALGTPEARALLKELAGGHAGAVRTQEAKRALERNTR